MRAIERFFNAPFWAIALTGLVLLGLPGLILATSEPVLIGCGLLLLVLVVSLLRQYRAEHHQ